MSLTSEQIEARRYTIGGSDMGAILGENNYKTAYEVWEEKIEGKTIDLSKNKSVVIGNLLEFPLIKKYEKNYDKICGAIKTVHHKKYNFLSANIDALTISNKFDYGIMDFYKDFEENDKRSVLEIKTASCFNKDEWGVSGSQIVPKQYYAQIAHYMLVTGCNKADISVGFVDDKVIGEVLCELNSSRQFGVEPDFSKIVDSMETRLYTFHKDEEMDQLILDAGVSFYENYMKPWIDHGIKNPPPMDFSNKSFQDCLKKKYSIVEESEIRLPSEFLEIKRNYISAMIQSKKFDKIVQEEKAKIIEAMGNNQKALLNDGTYFSRKMVFRKGFVAKDCEYIKFEMKHSRDSRDIMGDF